jgi:hypothetical protein
MGADFPLALPTRPSKGVALCSRTRREGRSLRGSEKQQPAEPLA